MSEEQKTEESAAFDSEALNRLEAEFSEGLAADEKAAAGVVAGSDLAPLMAGAIGGVCSIFAPNWNIESEEVEQLSIVWVDVLEDFFPDGIDLGPYDKLIKAGVITATIVVPRLGTPRKPEEKPAARPEARKDQFPSVMNEEG